MNLVNTYNVVVDKLSNLKSLPLLLLRLVLAYGFYNPAKMKWADISSIASWFESLGYPLPTLNAYMAAGLEAIGVVLLFLGLGTRLIAFPLMFVMFIAIATVHWGNGFESGSNGFEIPLYYLLMLFTLLIYGGGKYSLDNLIKNRK